MLARTKTTLAPAVNNLDLNTDLLDDNGIKAELGRQPIQFQVPTVPTSKRRFLWKRSSSKCSCESLDSLDGEDVSLDIDLLDCDKAELGKQQMRSSALRVSTSKRRVLWKKSSSKLSSDSLGSVHGKDISFDIDLLDDNKSDLVKQQRRSSIPVVPTSKRRVLWKKSSSKFSCDSLDSLGEEGSEVHVRNTSFRRFVYQQARIRHFRRGSFQSRCRGDGPRAPLLILMECFVDIKLAVRSCLKAETAITSMQEAVRIRQVGSFLRDDAWDEDMAYEPSGYGANYMEPVEKVATLGEISLANMLADIGCETESQQHE